MSAAEIEDVLYHRSGLAGVSGISSDMRTLLASDDSHAHEAVELFVFRAALEVIRRNVHAFDMDQCPSSP